MPPKKKKRKPRSRARGSAASPAVATAEQGPQSQEKRRERLDARREAKAKAAAKRYKQQRRARVVRTVVLLASAVAIVWFLFVRGGIPSAIAGYELEKSDTFTSESAANTLHTTDPITYEEAPPVSGQHSPNPAPCGVYGEPIPNENMVHSLEHGAVGVLYAPDAPVDEIKEIETIVQEYDSHAFSAPYEGLETPYTVVAWANLMRLDSVDKPAIREFFEVFREGGDAPEQTPCPMDSDEPFEPSATASPGASASPGPEETPHVDATPHEESEATEETEGTEGSSDKKKKKND